MLAIHLHVTSSHEPGLGIHRSLLSNFFSLYLISSQSITMRLSLSLSGAVLALAGLVTASQVVDLDPSNFETVRSARFVPSCTIG